MPVHRGAKFLWPIAMFALSGLLAARPLDAASSQLRVTVRVMPSKQAVAAQALVSVIAPNGVRTPLALSTEEKQALTSRSGYVPLQGQALGQGVQVIQIDF